MKEKEEKQELILLSIKHKALSIISENIQLHQEILGLMDKSSHHKCESLINKLKEEKEALNFVLTQIKSNLIESKKENESIKIKYEALSFKIYMMKIMGYNSRLISNNLIDH